MVLVMILSRAVLTESGKKTVAATKADQSIKYDEDLRSLKNRSSSTEFGGLTLQIWVRESSCQYRPSAIERDTEVGTTLKHQRPKIGERRSSYDLKNPIKAFKRNCCDQKGIGVLG